MRSDKERFSIQCLAWRASSLCLEIARKYLVLIGDSNSMCYCVVPCERLVACLHWTQSDQHSLSSRFAKTNPVYRCILGPAFRSAKECTSHTTPRSIFYFPECPEADRIPSNHSRHPGISPPEEALSRLCRGCTRYYPSATHSEAMFL